MRGFEPLLKPTAKAMGKHENGRDDFWDDANDTARSKDDFNGQGGDSGGRNDDDAQSERSDQANVNVMAAAGGRPQQRQHGRSGGIGGRRLEPPPWECSTAWSHADMRTSLAAAPHVPKPRVGLGGGGLHGQGGRYGGGGGGFSLPPAAFGDLNLLLCGNGANGGVGGGGSGGGGSGGGGSLLLGGGELGGLSARPGLVLDADFLPPRDHWDLLRRLAFCPATGLAGFCRLLGVSAVEESPVATAPALAAALFDLGRRNPSAALPPSEHGGGGGGRRRSAESLSADGGMSLGGGGGRPRWTQRLAAASAEALLDEGRRAGAVPAESGWLPVRFLLDGLIERFGTSGGSSSGGGGGRGGSGSGASGGGGVSKGRGGPAAAAVAARGGRPFTVLDRVRRMLVDSCGPLGLGELRRTLSLMDEDGSGTLDLGELRKGFGKLGLNLNAREAEEVFFEFDKDHSLSIDYAEFMDGIRGPMSKGRAALVQQAWDLVSGGAPCLHVDDLVRSFDTDWCPSVAAFRAKQQQMLLQAQHGQHEQQGQRSQRPPSAGGRYEAPGGEGVDPAALMGALRERFGYCPDGEVRFEDFFEFHRDVGACVDGGRLFEAFVRNAWHLSP